MFVRVFGEHDAVFISGEAAFREKAARGEDRVEPEAGMSFGENEKVALRPGGVSGIDIHLLEIQISQQVDD